MQDWGDTELNFRLPRLGYGGQCRRKRIGPKLVAICSQSISFRLSCECVWYLRSASLWMAKATESSCGANDESIIIITIRNAVFFAVRIVHRYIHDTPYTNASVLFTWPLCETHIAHSNLVDLTMGLGEWAITMPMANGEGRGRDMNRGDMVADRTEVACNGELQLTEWLLPRSTIQDITANHSMVWRAFAASTILC